MRYDRRFIFLFTTVVFVAASGCGGFNTAKAERPAAARAQAFDTSDFGRVKKLITDKYVTVPPDDKALFYGSIKGMVEALDDPYSEFTDPEETKLFEQRMSGTFFGIGAEVGEQDGSIIIAAPMDGSPAAKAGLKPGDTILKVDDEYVSDLKTIRKVVEKIRGPKGTKVKLTIMRKGFDKAREIEIVRDEIVVIPVKTKIVKARKKTVMVVTVTQFNEKAAQLFVKAAVEAYKKKVDGFVLDLRGNPGGMVGVAGIISCTWIPDDQPYAILAPRDAPAESLKCEGTDLLKDMPTVVLVNGYSASASEITAGALQDYGKARIIGEKTFGKGVGQNIYKFPDGAELRLTTFYWNTPKNRSIHKKGIEPDEKVVPGADEAKTKKDAQLEAAVTYLTK
jgi:carboxyl-terminal processing protease